MTATNWPAALAELEGEVSGEETVMFESGAEEFAPMWERLNATGAVTEQPRRRRGLIGRGPIPLRDCIVFVIACVFIGFLIGAYLAGNW